MLIYSKLHSKSCDYLYKLLNSDWLRAMQFLGNTVQKKGNSVQKRENKMQICKRTKHSDWLINRGSLESQSNATSEWRKFPRKIWMNFCWSRQVKFHFATATTMQELKYSSENEDTVKRTVFWWTVGKKWCLEQETAEWNRKLWAGGTVCLSDFMLKLNQRWRRLWTRKPQSDVNSAW